MSAGDYLIGVGFAVTIWGSAAVVGAVTVRRRLGALEPVARGLAVALVALCALIAAHLIPGTVAVLSRESVALVSGVMALATWRFVPAVPRRPGGPSPSGPPRRDLLSLVPAAIATAGVALLALASFARLAPDAPGHIDALSFGLPGVAEWIRSGSTLEVGAFFPLFEVRTYPNNGDVLYLAAVLPFDNDSFVRFPAPALLAMLGLAVYALCRELRAPPAPAALAAALVLALPTVGEPALDHIKPDVFMYATFAAGLVFLLRHARTGERAHLALAGAGLGLAFGARWYGISSVVAVFFVWIVATAVARRVEARRLIGQALLLVGLVLLAGGYWLLRNAVLTGNPVYPVDVSPFGFTIFGAPPNVFAEGLGASIADRLGLPGLLSDFIWPEYRERLGAPALALALGCVASMAIGLHALRTRRDLSAAAAVICAGCAILLAGVYAITPASAQGFTSEPIAGFIGANTRWLVPAFITAAAATAWVVGRAGRLRTAAEVLIAIAALLGARKAYSASAADVAVLAGAMGAIAGAGVLLRRWAADQPGRSRLLAAAGAATLACTSVAAGYLHQRHFNDRRFAGVSPVSSWIQANAPDGHKVGFAGGWQSQYVPIYAAFGPTYGNDVGYVGSLATGSVRRYRRPAGFRRALVEGDYDLLVVGRTAFPALDRPRPLRTYADPPQARWARTVGFQQVAEEPQFVLLAAGDLATGAR